MSESTPDTAGPAGQDRIQGSAAVPAWQRWRIRKDFMAPGNQWDVTHDCGWTTRVDLAENAAAVIEAEQSHDRECR